MALLLFTKLLLILMVFQTTSGQGSFTAVNFDLTWSNNGDSTEFVMTTKQAASLNSYFAFGFSSDNKMGEDDLAICKYPASGQGVIEHYYNPSGYSPSVYMNIDDKTIGFSNMNVNINNGILTCSFTRQNSFSNVANYVDSNGEYFIISASGQLDTNNNPSYHMTNRTASNSAISFISSSSTTVSVTEASTTNAPTTQATTTNVGATFSGGLYQGVFEVRYEDAADSTNFVMIANVNGDSYIAMGFSNDNRMGEDDVAICTTNGVVEHYFNPSSYNPPQIMNSNDRTIGFSNIVVTFENGVLTCTFTRQKTMNSQANYANLETPNTYFILTASGSLNSGSPNFHGTSRGSSANAIDLTKGGNSVNVVDIGKQNRNKAHGSLMVFAWMFFASTGIFLARYCKFLLPTKTMCGVKVWFGFHRPMMMFVPVLSIIALLVILSALDWKWVPTRLQTNFTHSIFGIITIGFSFFQVLFAFCRPGPDHSKRFIFNYFHRGLGMLTFLCSIVALFLGVVLNKMNLGSKGWGLVLGWLLWIIIKDLIVEIFQLLLTNKRADSYSIDNNGLNTAADNSSNKNLETLKTVILLLHVIISLAFTIALVVIIGIA